MSSTKQWQGQACSNIAIIKYMGKVDHDLNLPLNSSLSYHLPHLQTQVNLVQQELQDTWEPLDPGFTLTPAAQERFLAHLQLLKKKTNTSSFFLVRSSNNFATGCGLASSASSFAALTKAFMQFVATEQPHLDINLQTWASWSRQGSGSSIRSFIEPWCQWDHVSGEVSAVPSHWPQLIHRVELVADREKEVGSSQAHRRVETSSLFAGRAPRAQSRLDDCKQALAEGDWSTLCRRAYEDFWDMMAMFHTAQPHFSYMTAKSIQVIEDMEALWKKTGRGPLLTMDAGPNVHLLYRPEDQDLV